MKLCQHGPDRRREDGGGRPVILAPDRRDLVGERDGNVRKARAERRAQRRFVSGVAVAEEEVDRDGPARARAVGAARTARASAVGAASADQGGHRVEDARDLDLVQRRDDAALVVDALAHAEAVAPRDAGLRPAPAQVVGMGPRDAADQRDVLEARAAQIEDARARALEAGVGRDGRAEHEVAHRLRRDARAVEGIEHADLGRRRGARPLRHDDPAALVDGDEVSVGAPGIDTDTQHRPPLPARLRHAVPNALRSAAQATAWASAATSKRPVEVQKPWMWPS